MGFNSYYVRSVEDVKSDYQSLGEIKFKKIYSKYNDFRGDEEGIKMIIDILNGKKTENGK